MSNIQLVRLASVKTVARRTSGDASSMESTSRNGENHRSSYITEVGRTNRSRQTTAVAKQVQSQAKNCTNSVFKIYEQYREAGRGTIYTTFGASLRGAGTSPFLACVSLVFGLDKQQGFV